MSPEIRVQGKLIASVPDETGTYRTCEGKAIYVNVDGIHAHNETQKIVLEGEEIGGRRTLKLTHQGIGESSDPKRGDQLTPEISVSLLNRPIRVSIQEKKVRMWHDSRSLGEPRGGYYTYADSKRTYNNPYWLKDHGQR